MMDRVNNEEEMYAKKFIEATMGFSDSALKLFNADETAGSRLMTLSFTFVATNQIKLMTSKIPGSKAQFVSGQKLPMPDLFFELIICRCVFWKDAKRLFPIGA